MADYITVTDSAIDPDAPLTSELAYAWRDNCVAIAEGAVGAPRVYMRALERPTAGDIVRYSRDTSVNIAGGSGGVDGVALVLGIIQTGVIRCAIEKTAGNGEIRIIRWRAGVNTTLASSIAIGVLTFDVSVIPGDTIKVTYSVVAGGALEYRNVRFSTGGEDLWPGPIDLIGSLTNKSP